MLQGDAVARLPLDLTDADLRTVAYQQEHGESAGKLHVQGFVAYRVKVTARVAATKLGIEWNRRSEVSKSQVSFRPAKGSIQQNIAYCSSEYYCRNCKGSSGSPIELPLCECGQAKAKGRVPGTTVVHGDATDIKTLTAEALVDAARCGASTSMLLVEYPREMVKWSRQWQFLMSHVGPQRQEKPLVVWLWGPSGAGKSRFVAECVDVEHVFMTWSAQWYDGYDPSIHHVFCFDDFRGGDYAPAWLLRVLDRYPLKLPIKGGSVEFRAPVVVVTSPSDVESSWQEVCQRAQRQESIDQLRRRIDYERYVPMGEAENDSIRMAIRSRIKSHVGAVRERVHGWRPSDAIIPSMFSRSASSTETANPELPVHASDSGSTLHLPNYQSDIEAAHHGQPRTP